MRFCVIRAYEKTIAFGKGKNEYLRYLKGISHYSIKYIRNKNTLTAYRFRLSWRHGWRKIGKYYRTG